MAMSLTQACRSLALSTWLLSFCFVHLLCLDFTVAEKEEWYTAFVNITYLDPVTSEIKTDKSECGRYGEHSPKRDARGFVFMPSLLQDRQVCDSNTKFPLPHPSIPWIALIAIGNCTYREKIRHAAALNASAVVIFNVGSSNSNETITMPHHVNFLLQYLATFASDTVITSANAAG
ncbi:RING finger protein 150-like [Sinocyclocheilus anshuiensis]|uniref:RING finger protein 150-like n=1 Tax=Sinocyclocheilus anshuiensis TaxID=1608454 RepID=UPI0007B8A7B3|nr:PREDICTED: RING finger protein 150-like [Sinocyclocheilus anshuiensis]